MPTPKSYAGPISPETVERWRSQGRSDDTIAEYMSQANTSFAQQYQRIRQASGGDPRATTAFLNTRFYGDANYMPQSPEPKGFVGKTLDLVLGYPGRVVERINDRIVDVEQSLEDRREGKQGALNTFGQTASNLYRIGLAPVTQFTSDVVGGAMSGAGALDQKFTGGQVSQSLQEGVQAVTSNPTVQQIGQGYSRLRESSPTIRTIEDVGMAGLDTLDVLGTGAAMKAAKPYAQGVVSAVRHPVQTLTQTAPHAVGRGIGTAAAVPKNLWKGMKQGFTGKADDAARTATGKADDAVMAAPLAGKAQEAVDKGVDERLVRFIAERDPDERFLMKAMVKEAEAGTRKLGGTTKHKEIVGEQILRNAEHIIDYRENVGKALGNIAASMGDETVDLTDAAQQLFREMSNKGVVFSRETGKILSAAGYADDEIPILQKLAGFFQPDDQGRVLRTFREGDLFRKKLFSELNVAKGKLAPTQAGQSAFSASEGLANSARSLMLRQMGALNPNYQKLASAYAELMTEPADFFTLLGYKGPLDEIGKKALGTGEKAMRVLGNASDRPTEALQRLFKTARKYGYEPPSETFEMDLIRFADELENVFPIAPTRALRGEVGRGVADQFAKNTIQQKGAIRGALSTVDEKIYDAYQWARGMTPENRLKLLNELLDASPDESFAVVAAQVLPDEQLDDLNRVVAENLTVDDAIEPVAATTNLSRSQVEDMLKSGQQVPEEQLARYPDLFERYSGVKPNYTVADSMNDRIPSDIPLSQIDNVDAARVKTLNKAGLNDLTDHKLYQADRQPMPGLADDLNNLTPEEKATGLLGGGGDNMPRTSPKGLPRDGATDEIQSLYHGTDRNFDQFDVSKATRYQFGDAIYFGDNADVAKQYGKTVKEAGLKKSQIFDLGKKGSPNDTRYMTLAREQFRKATGKDLDGVLKQVRSKSFNDGTPLDDVFFSYSDEASLHPDIRKAKNLANEALKKEGYAAIKAGDTTAIFNTSALRPAKPSSSDFVRQAEQLAADYSVAPVDKIERLFTSLPLEDQKAAAQTLGISSTDDLRKWAKKMHGQIRKPINAKIKEDAVNARFKIIEEDAARIQADFDRASQPAKPSAGPQQKVMAQTPGSAGPASQVEQSAPLKAVLGTEKVDMRRNVDALLSTMQRNIEAIHKRDFPTTPIPTIRLGKGNDTWIPIVKDYGWNEAADVTNGMQVMSMINRKTGKIHDVSVKGHPTKKILADVMDFHPDQ